MSRNFGECQSIDVEPSLFTGFISALQTFAREITQSVMKSVNFEEFNFKFFKDPKISELYYVLVTDLEDEPALTEVKLIKIAELFRERYGTEILQFRGDISLFEEFGDLLIEMKIAQKNCGGRPECDGCPNSIKTSKIIEFYKRERKGLFSRLKAFFRRT
ncbi:MAG: hypothetical protein ACTSRS_11630 [Candidatus Helarchaeota archaeon]